MADEGKIMTLPGGRGGLKVRCFDSRDDAAAYVTNEVATALAAAIDARGKAIWVGAGGTTPRPVYERLSEAVIDWSVVTMAQVDERFVPVDDGRSNTRMMTHALNGILDDDAVPGMVFLSLIEDIDDQDNCAAEAEKTLLELGEGAPPLFDFALMGMGNDGHYASIFPNHAINAFVYDTKALVLPVAATEDGSEPVLPRITLTVPALNRSRRIVFLIYGDDKVEVLTRLGAVTDPYKSPIGAFTAQCPVDIEFVWAA